VDAGGRPAVVEQAVTITATFVNENCSNVIILEGMGDNGTLTFSFNEGINTLVIPDGSFSFIEHQEVSLLS
jgi:hypothetical protein